MCPIESCRKTFQSKNDLDRHMISVHRISGRNTKYYRCFARDCTKPDKDWLRLDNFRQHLRSMHANEDTTELLRL